MIARKCDICGEFFEPYLVSNTISGKRDSYYQIKVTENDFISRVQEPDMNMMLVWNAKGNSSSG